MKQISIYSFLFLLFFIPLKSKAEVCVPIYFSDNFSEQCQNNLHPGDGWTIYANEATPTEFMSQLLNEASAGFEFIVQSPTVVANTEFEPSVSADQWLITPAIDIESDYAEIYFKSYVFSGFGNRGNGSSTFKVLVSEKGIEKEDFKEDPLFEGRVSYQLRINSSNNVIAPINGYKGKKVHLAFVVTAKDSGLIGFSDIRIGEYTHKIYNKTVTTGEIGSTYDVSINGYIQTPIDCKNLKASLYVNNVKTDQQIISGKFGYQNNSFVTGILHPYEICFEDAILIKDYKPVSYKVEITPEIEGATPSFITGQMDVAKIKYPNNVVVEELTATGCGYCPRGTASIEYYKDKYQGTETQGKAICIALHGSVNYRDPMSVGVEDYLRLLQDSKGDTGFPAAYFNRSTKGLDPTTKEAFEERIEQFSDNLANIKSVNVSRQNYAPGNETFKFNVEFDVRNSFTATDRELKASIILIENDIQGDNGFYIQTNYFDIYEPEAIADAYGDWILPYMSKYLKGGELNQRLIPYEDIRYDHVARGIFPNYVGTLLPAEWTADVPVSEIIDFEIPESRIKNLKNTEIVVVVTDDRDNIVASDIFPYSNYSLDQDIEQSNIVEFNEDNISFEVSNGNLIIKNATPDTEIGIYSFQGEKIKSIKASASTTSCQLPLGRPYIIKSGDFVKKVLF